MKTGFKTFLKKRKNIVIGSAIVIVIALLIFGKHSKSNAQISSPVSLTSVADKVVLSGTVQSASAVDLAFADQGRVQSVFVKEGDIVHKGQVLAMLDSADLQASLSDAKASVVIAENTSASSQTNLDTVTKQQDTLVQNAYRAMLSGGLQAVAKNSTTSVTAPIIGGTYTADTEGQYTVTCYASSANSGASFTISGLESGYSQSVSGTNPVPLGSKGLTITFPDNPLLYAGTTWIVSIPNTLATSYGTNQNNYLAAKAARDQAIASAQSSLSANDSNQSIAQAQIQQAQAKVASIIASIEKREIIAPFDGVVANIALKPGQTTSLATSGSSTTITSSTITLISQNDYQVLLKVPENAVGKLVAGQHADIALDAYDGEVFSGTVVSIDPAETIVDGVPVYQTKVTFDKNDERIRSGMTAIATIVVAKKDSVLAIPASAITTKNGASFVQVIAADGKTTQQQITTGLRGSDSMVEVTSGLSEGQNVVTATQ